MPAEAKAEPDLACPMSLQPERHWFIYYRVSAALETEVVAMVRSFQAGLAAAQGALAVGLMRRTQVDEHGDVTFMETYCWNGPELPSSVMVQILNGAPDLAQHLQGLRHVEEFAPCA